MKKLSFISSQQLEDILDKFHKKSLLEKKRNYTWLIVALSVVAVAGIGIAIYKCFFASDGCDCCCDDDDYYDDDDDIDFDEDYDDDDFEETEVVDEEEEE